MVNPLWTYDRKRCKSFNGILGVDEAGRGCLAGPVVAGAVLLPSLFFTISGNRRACSEINDSKQLKGEKREELYQSIVKLGEKGQLFWAMGEASVDEIESENIVGATCLAMKRAMKRVSDLSNGIWKPNLKKENDLFVSNEKSKSEWIVSVDGRTMKRLPYEHEGIIKGDTMSLAVAMGSLIAKVTRDRKMKNLSKHFPSYDFSSNKGYGSPNHLKALQSNGPCQHHRPKFLRNIIQSEISETKIKPHQSRLSLF